MKINSLLTCPSSAAQFGAYTTMVEGNNGTAALSISSLPLALFRRYCFEPIERWLRGRGDCLYQSAAY